MIKALLRTEGFPVSLEGLQEVLGVKVNITQFFLTARIK